jgi:putative sigma-54 modulation protein
MKKSFTFKHLDHSKALMSYTSERLDEVSPLLLKEGNCTVLYSKFKHEFSVEFAINSKQKYFRATGSASDIYVAVDLAIDRLEKQLLKTRKINKSHKKFELSKEGRLNDVNPLLEYHPENKRAI